jgi:hydroxyethylthiazole kinase-like uncharacterized protein yjeF
MDRADPLVTATQMREIEADAIRSGAVSGAVLMAAAAEGTVAATLARWPTLAAAPGRAVVLAGPGNNGGDGYGIAHRLAARGWHVRVFAAGDPATLPPDAAAEAARWSALGPIEPLGALTAGPLAEADLVFDAVFGTGLTRPADLVAAAQALLAGVLRGRTVAGTTASGPRLVAVDLPSGLCADSGRVLGAEGPGLPADMPRADLTVTFGATKPGHRLGHGPALCGPVVTVPLGRAVAAALAARAATRTLLHAVPAPAPARLAKDPDGHKYAHGHALVLAGPPGAGGAARLAARAALRVGAGLVTLGVPGAALTENAARLDAVMLAVIDDAAALAARLADRRLRALALGPGLGQDTRAGDLLMAALEADRPLVLDADALRLLARRPEAQAMLAPHVVLTPHEGEFTALAPDLAEALRAPARHGPAFSRVDAARVLARRLNATLVLKGPATVIARPDGQARVHGGTPDRAAPWLATAGSGDVLTGLVAGLMARGLAPAQAACDAVWLHVEAARRTGPGLIAEDLPDVLPAVLAGVLTDEGGGASR